MKQTGTMRCPDKRVVAVTTAVIIILIVSGVAVMNGFSLFGTTTTKKNNDITTFKESPHSSSNNLHIVITGSVVGVVLLIISMIAVRALASRDKRQEELTNRKRMEPPVQSPVQPWFPSAPIQNPPILPIHHVNQDFMYGQYGQQTPRNEEPLRYQNRYLPLEIDANERRHLKRIAEETFNDDNEKEQEIKRLKADRKELLHLRQVMKE